MPACELKCGSVWHRGGGYQGLALEDGCAVCSLSVCSLGDAVAGLIRQHQQ